MGDGYNEKTFAWVFEDKTVDGILKRTLFKIYIPFLKRIAKD